MRVAVLLNRAAGTVDRKADLLELLTAAFERFEVNAQIVETGPGELASRAKSLAGAGGIDALVLGGGDGSIGAVAKALIGRELPLGLLPLGTLNHFARDAGIPLNLEGAVGVIAGGHRQRVDVAEVNGRVFVNNCSVGLYPLIVRDREMQRVRLGRGRWPATARAAVKAAWSLSSRRLSIRVAGTEHRIETPVLFVGVNRYRTALFGLGRRPALDGGELVLYAVRARTRLGITKAMLRALLGRLDQARDFTVIDDVKAARIESPRRSLDIAVDGETMRVETPLRCRLHPCSVALLVPANGDSRSDTKGDIAAR